MNIFNKEIFIFELQNSPILRINETAVIYNDFTTIKVSINDEDLFFYKIKILLYNPYIILIYIVIFICY